MKWRCLKLGNEFLCPKAQGFAKEKQTEEKHIGELVSEGQITLRPPGPVSRSEDKRAY